MISTEEALQLVLASASKLDPENVATTQAIGRVLAEDIFADRQMPPFDRVTMDGIAICFASYQDETTLFPIEAVGPAGAPQLTLKDASYCIEIMTGASLPKGTDTVVRYEDLDKSEAGVRILKPVRKGQNIHWKGSDHSENSILLKAGLEIKAIDINVLATVGKSSVNVMKSPKVAVISSGDELVDIDHTPAEYQIRKSNVHMISARLNQLGVESKCFHFKDKEEEIFSEMTTILDQYDVLVMSGGVSKGKFDFIPEVLDRIGFKKGFHKVAQRPGKPFWFGTKEEKTVFAFPGNPVSTLACFQKYFLPWLEKTTGQVFPILKVVLSEDVLFKPSLTYYAQAFIEQKSDGRFYATVSHGNGSGDIVNPSSMHGFLEFPPEKELFKAGEIFDFRPFYPIYK
ncbi:MAG: molybdopterin molybdotransferase MoeA [Saprospiraceae bacterium]|nr:molybdopterin molybdotransferase MoeA [Saprospiraceae bacterium]